MLTNRHNIKPIYKINEKGEQIRIIFDDIEEEEREVFIPKPKPKTKFDIKETWYYKLAQSFT